MFTLAHLSDPHLAPLPRPQPGELFNKRITGYLNWLRGRHRMHRREVLDAIVADVKAAGADHIAVTGDIANISLAEEFLRGRKWLDALGKPSDVTFIPGNHDAYVRAAAHDPERYWADYMSGDGEDGPVAFPFVRRRGAIALIGTSTAVPTPPFMATGWLGQAQIARLAAVLDALKKENLFRVLLIHHPPVSPRERSKRLLDAADVLKVVATHGAELILHGHDHVPMLNWLDTPNGRAAAIGVPSASGAPAFAKAPAAWNLYRISGARGAWQCEMISRAITRDGSIAEISRANVSPANAR
ncbi:MAG TPA: metallophosphoesterase [Pseudolabrys sp.]|nr:metallophosphoesterase [Pseudolabrys sp.]